MRRRVNIHLSLLASVVIASVLWSLLSLETPVGSFPAARSRAPLSTGQRSVAAISNHPDAPAAESLPTTEESTVTPEEARVLSAAVEGAIIEREMPVREGSHVMSVQLQKVAIIHSSLYGDSPIEAADEALLQSLGVPLTVLTDWRRTPGSSRLEQPLTLSIESVLAPPQDCSNCDYYNMLNDRYPGFVGPVTLSRPKFDRSHRWGLVKLSIKTGPGTAPHGEVLIVLQKHSTWEVSGVTPTASMLDWVLQVSPGR